MKNNKKATLIFGGACIILILDFITKWLIATKMILGQSFVLIPKILSLTYVQNIGAGFSILQGQQVLLSIIGLVVVGFIFYYYKQIPKIKYVQWSVMLILGGTLGNMLERMFNNYVTDFIHIGIWPKFNIADSCVVIGGIGLAYYFWKEEKNEKQKKTKEVRHHHKN